jgi:hypothetical protein
MGKPIDKLTLASDDLVELFLRNSYAPDSGMIEKPLPKYGKALEGIICAICPD